MKRGGYNVELVPADYIAQFAGLQTGDLHVAMEMWETTGRDAIDEYTADGRVVNVGSTGMDAIEEWWYPSYMKEKCPGLPNWEALNDCAEAFSIPETAPKGRYLGGPVTWGGFDNERVEALELDWEVIHAGTDAALFAELESAYQRKAPIMLWVYAPHWAPAKFEGEWNFETLNSFLIKPKDYIKGTKMIYAGLKKEKDRASVILYLNEYSDNPLQLP